MSSSTANRSFRIAYPLAPGAGVEPSAQARQLERQEIVARRHAGATVDSRLRPVGSERRVSSVQLFAGPEDRNLAAREVVGKRGVDRSRNVSRSRIERLAVTAVALGRSRIEQQLGP